MSRQRTRKMSCKQKQARRHILFERQNGLCYWCGKKLNLFSKIKPQHNKRMMTLDHIIFHCIGGSDDLANLVGACIHCNIQRAIWFEKSRGRFVIIGQELI